MADLNSDGSFAIRRFCAAARPIQQEQAQIDISDFRSLVNIHTTTPDNSASDSREEKDFVDSFFSIDRYDNDNSTNSLPLEQQEFGGFTSMMLSESYGDLSMLTDEEPSDDLAPEVDQRLELVHLLLSCAEAVGCRDTRLSHSLLTQIRPAVTPFGDSLQRVCHCFASGLQSRLGNAVGTTILQEVASREEKKEAYRWLHQTIPYMAFGFMAANDAIFQASKGKECLHIIDLGMVHTLQWCSFIRTVTTQADSHPPRLIRITGIIEETQDLLELQVLAASSGISLEFQVIKEPVTASLFTREKLDVREGEALIVNGVMQLHEYMTENKGILKTILQAIKKLGPAVFTVVEHDANHNGPFFLGRFLESLHYYSAIFDSLEASLPRDCTIRAKIERSCYAEEIRNIVAYEGSDRTVRHERADQWHRQLGRAGFQVVGLKCMSQAQAMLSIYSPDGYTLATDKGCLLLGWKGRPIMFASAWEVLNVASS